MRKMIYALIAVIALPCLLLGALSCAAKRPAIGLVDGKLRSCPSSPNCVSSESDSPASRVEPLAFEGDAKVAWTALAATIKQMDGSIQESRDYYLWATFTTKVFRFKDDLECRLDADNQVIHVRSGSRVGHSDLGVNRRRIETLREEFGRRLRD